MKLPLVYTSFEGGLGTDLKIGLKNSFAGSAGAGSLGTYGVDFRKNPSQFSTLPGTAREDGGIVNDLIQNEVMTPDGTIYAVGAKGGFYKRTTAGAWSREASVGVGTFGINYRRDTDNIYIAQNKHVSVYSSVSNSPAMYMDFYGPSYSTYNNSTTVGFNVAAFQSGSELTYTPPTSVIENATNLRYFQSDIEPLTKISVFVASKGTGDWTLTLHDGNNKVLGTSTVTNANLTNGVFNDFVFSSATNGQVRIYIAPNARTYHIHVTSTVADGSLACTTDSDLSTCDLQVWADRLVQTNNGMHPWARFQQYECLQGNTTIPTKEGVFQVKDLVGKQVSVIAGDGEYREVAFESYGEKELYEVRFRTGEVIQATAEHRWRVKSGNNPSFYVTTKDLSGRRVPRVVAGRPAKDDDYYDGLRHGIVYGDGTLYNKYGKDAPYVRSRAVIFEHDYELLEYFEDHKVSYHTSPLGNRKEFAVVYGLPASYKKLPPDQLSPSYWYGFICGLIATDGCVDTRDGCITIAQSNLKDLQTIRKHLPRIGLVGGNPTLLSEAGTEVEIDGVSRTRRRNCYSLNLKKQYVQPDDIILSYKRDKLQPAKGYSLFATVTSVEATGIIEEVFCCQEPVTTEFVIDNGILTGNCIGNANYISVWEPLNSTDTTTMTSPETSAEWVQHRLVFPMEYECYGLDSTNEFLVGALGQTTSSNNFTQQAGLLFFWDGVSPTYNYFVPIPEGTPMGMHTYKNVVYYYAGGALWGITSPTTQPVKLRTMPGTDTEFSGTTAPFIVYPYSMTVRRGIHLFGFPSMTTNTTANFGVYSWGAVDKNYPDSLGYSYLISTGSTNYSNTNNLTIGMVKSFGDTLHISWRDDVNGGYGVDVVNNSSPPATNSSWESLIFDNGFTAKNKKAIRLYVDYLTVPADASFKLKYKINRAANWSYSPVFSGSSLTSDQSHFDISPVNYFHEFQFGIDITAGTTPVVITSMCCIYDDTREEPVGGG